MKPVTNCICGGTPMLKNDPNSQTAFIKCPNCGMQSERCWGLRKEAVAYDEWEATQKYITNSLTQRPAPVVQLHESDGWRCSYERPY